MSGLDEFGQHTFSDLDPVNLGVDLTKAADAVGNGPFRVGSQTDRLATEGFTGLLWFQTDATVGLYIYKGEQWHFYGPTRSYSTTVNISVSNAASGNVQVPFPAGRFTSTPFIQVTRATAQAANWLPFTVPGASSKDSAYVAIYNTQGGNSTITIPVTVTATQND